MKFRACNDAGIYITAIQHNIMLTWVIGRQYCLLWQWLCSIFTPTRNWESMICSEVINNGVDWGSYCARSWDDTLSCPNIVILCLRKIYLKHYFTHIFCNLSLNYFGILESHGGVHELIFIILLYTTITPQNLI